MRRRYSSHVNSKRNVLLAFAAAIAIFGSGCGGLGASGSVSPATFLLPGLGQAAPKAPEASPEDNSGMPLSVSPPVAAISGAAVL